MSSKKASGAQDGSVAKGWTQEAVLWLAVHRSQPQHSFRLARPKADVLCDFLTAVKYDIQRPYLLLEVPPGGWKVKKTREGLMKG